MAPSSKKPPPKQPRPKKPPSSKTSSKKKKTSSLAAHDALVQEDFESGENETQELYKKEKDLLPKYTSPPSLFFGSSTSRYWAWVIHVRWQEFEQLLQINGKELRETSFPGIKRAVFHFDEKVSDDDDEEKDRVLSPPEIKEKFEEIHKRLVLCPLCYRDPSKPLNDAVIICSDKRPSNIFQHQKHHHKDIFEELQKEMNPSSLTKTPPSNQRTLTGFKAPVQPRKAASLQLQRKIYEFVNDCCLPASTVEKPQFRELLDYAFRNGNQLKDTRAECMSRREITKHRVNSYQEFIQTVSTLAIKVRAAYKNLCKHEIAFATICHDIW